jgi:hypothetical protein
MKQPTPAEKLAQSHQRLREGMEELAAIYRKINWPKPTPTQLRQSLETANRLERYGIPLLNRQELETQVANSPEPKRRPPKRRSPRKPRRP